MNPVTIIKGLQLGAVTSLPVTIPKDTIGWLRVLIQIDDSYHSDPLLSLWIRIQLFNGISGQWEEFHAAKWEGNKGTKIGDMIGAGIPIFDPTAEPTKTPDYRSQQLRVVLEPSAPMIVGYTIENVLDPRK